MLLYIILNIFRFIKYMHLIQYIECNVLVTHFYFLIDINFVVINN